MWYVYNCHLSGNAFSTNEYMSYEELYCETCGDSDQLIDSFNTKEEADLFIEIYNNGEIEYEDYEEDDE